jgi:hypothetical protein
MTIPACILAHTSAQKTTRVCRGIENARREKALATMAGLVGALILSRAVDDPALSDEILKATATELGRR